MRSIKNSIIVSLSCLLCQCSNKDSMRVNLEDFQASTPIQYSTNTAIIYLSKEDVLEHCKAQDNGEPNDFMYRQVAQYLDQNAGNPVIVPDTLGALPGGKLRDENSPYSHVLKTIYRIILALAEDGKLRVVDKATGEAVKYITIKRESSDKYGETNIYLPNDSLIFSHLRWIR